MSAAPHLPRYTVAEYLAFERDSETKHEFIHGEIIAMAGASETHNTIVSNCIITLGGQLRGRPCKIYPSDMLLEVSPWGPEFYPDVSVVCGTPLIKQDGLDRLLNPNLLIEVLSRSTHKKDEQAKTRYYHSMDSVQDYLMIAQDHPLVEHYQRQDVDQWLLTRYRTLGATLELVSIGCTLNLADVYDKVNFDPPQAP
jgi:Uma2 family endonuclease